MISRDKRDSGQRTREALTDSRAGVGYGAPLQRGGDKVPERKWDDDLRIRALTMYHPLTTETTDVNRRQNASESGVKAFTDRDSGNSDSS